MDWVLSFRRSRHLAGLPPSDPLKPLHKRRRCNIDGLLEFPLLRNLIDDYWFGVNCGLSGLPFDKLTFLEASLSLKNYMILSIPSLKYVFISSPTLFPMRRLQQLHIARVMIVLLFLLVILL